MFTQMIVFTQAHATKLPIAQKKNVDVQLAPSEPETTHSNTYRAEDQFSIFFPPHSYGSHLFYCVVTKFRVARVATCTCILDAMVCFMDHEGVLVFFSFQVGLIEMTSIQLLPGEQKTQTDFRGCKNRLCIFLPQTIRQNLT